MAVRIGIGLGIGGMPFDSIAAFRSWVDLCEESRIDSIWQSDRVVSREPAFEPLTLLAVVAGATRRLKLGTNAIVLPFRDPVTFARQCASLDALSEGRLLPAVGIGRGDAPEWEATGRSPAGRGRRADEALAVITRLWSSESADFEGEIHSLKSASISPRPRQDPLPLWIGGASAAAVRRTARFGHGWLAPLQSPAEAGATVRAIQAECRRIGRTIADDHYGATILYRIGGGDAAPSLPGDRRSPALRERLAHVQAVGEPERMLERIREFRAAGVTKFIAVPLARDARDVMEQTRLLDREVLPRAND